MNKAETGTKTYICLQGGGGGIAIFIEEKDLVTSVAYELPVIESPARDEKGRYGTNTGTGLYWFL